MNQEETVYNVLKDLGGRARSEEIKIEAMRKGVSCGDRYIRWMLERGIIENIGKVKSDDRTDTYVIKRPYTPRRKAPPETLFNVERFSYDR